MVRLKVFCLVLLSCLSLISADPLEWGTNKDVANFRLDEMDESLRLPQDSFPMSYKLHLETKIHENDRKITGKVEIKIHVINPTFNIILHSRDLEIESVKTTTKNGTDAEVNEFYTDVKTEFLIITHENELPVGIYTVEIKFSGKLQTNEAGFYVSSYLNRDGVRKYLAVTQFEPVSARYAFPCYDEPAFKATFDLSITHGILYNAIANTNQVAPQVNISDTMATTTFKTTPKMSSYLLAFVVSDFTYRTNKDIQRVYARPPAFYKTVFALDAGEEILPAMSNYFGINYTDYIEKMTQIAIPDFAAGAMENWGLVTYREPALLFDNAVSTYRNKVSIASIISHEYAHQWFGNLVSPWWWSYVWLNEGFATLYESYATHLVYPGWEMMDLFRVNVIQSAFGPDGLENTRPMTYNASTPQQIKSLFDRIAYPKSGSVLFMFMNVLGEENWKEGLKNYILARQLDVAIADDLSAGLQEAVEDKNILPKDVKVKDLMDSWTTEKGYPVVNVKRSYASGQITLFQERFIFTRKENNPNVWWIPFDFTHASEKNFSSGPYHWLSSKADAFQSAAKSKEWIILNKQQVGYYRVNYDIENWNLLIDALHKDHTAIHRLNRAQLIDDSWNLARSDRLDFSVALNLMAYLSKENEYIPWASANKILNYLHKITNGREIHADFQTFAHNLVEHIYSTIDATEVNEYESYMHKNLRQVITNWACNLEIEDCLNKTAKALVEAVENGKAVHPDVSVNIYCHGLKSTGDKEFTYLYNKMMASDDQSYRSLLIDTLVCTKDPAKLEALLDSSIGSSSEINYEESERRRIVIDMYSTSTEGLKAVMSYLNGSKVDEFIKVLGADVLNGVIEEMAEFINDHELKNQFEALLVSLEGKTTEESKMKAKNTIEDNIAWSYSREGVFINQWLKDYIFEGTSSTEPQTSTEEPQTSTKESQTSSEEPQTSTEAPQTSTEELQTSTEEFTTQIIETTTQGAQSFTLHISCLILGLIAFYFN